MKWMKSMHRFSQNLNANYKIKNFLDQHSHELRRKTCFSVCKHSHPLFPQITILPHKNEERMLFPAFLCAHYILLRIQAAIYVYILYAPVTTEG